MTPNHQTPDMSMPDNDTTSDETEQTTNQPFGVDPSDVVDVTEGTDTGIADAPGRSSENVRGAHERAPRNAGWITDDMTRFQLDLLAAVTHLAREIPDEAYGGAVSTYLETWHGVHINHGRLYPNLNELAEMGLIEKSAMDDRTNQYAPTDTGLATLTRRWLSLGYALGLGPDRLADLGAEVFDQ